MRFLVDEDLPRSAALNLRQAGHQADHVRDVGLRGRPDREVFQWAQDHQPVLVTGDMGFASTVAFPLGSHWRIIVSQISDTCAGLLLC
jgi:predicted nuclease of predicted toxin-antitoxin system